MFEGCITAVVTPFRGRRLDLTGLRRNLRFQLAAGVSGILVAGSTGESPTLSDEEKAQLLETARVAAGSRIPVIAGVGTNDTTRSCRAAKTAEQLGAAALLVVAPYYNKPTQEGLYRHFRAVAESTNRPIIIYNIPSRCAVNILPVTIERLCRDCSNIVAVKEASGNLDQMSELLVRCGDRITLLSGDDSLTLPILSIGGRGVISVASNIVPAEITQLVRHFLAGETETAARLHQRLFGLYRALFCETNPIPVKAAMAMLGMAAGEPRPPLTPATDATVKTIRQALVQFGLKPRQ